ncbi:MAG: hypothetical protein VX402_03830, partial [Candidatus Thermoplasmatota archaeon]|nr:hypothetical protein [Candidatus Thermoplasmatota archaeon]
RNLDLHIAALIFMSGTQALVSGSEEGDVATTNALSLTEEDPEDPIPAPIPNIIAIPPFRPIGPTF